MILSQYEEWVPNRQAYPAAYDITTAVYVSSSDFIIKGRVQAIEIPEEHGIDIDTMLDFRLAELILEERKLDK